MPLYPREPCLFICYYIRIGRSKAGGPSAATTLAALVSSSVSFSLFLPLCTSLFWTSSTCFLFISLLPSFSLPLPLFLTVPLQSALLWMRGVCCVLAAVLVLDAHPTGASVGLHWWGFPSFNEDYHVCVCMCVMIILLVISLFQEQ